MRGPATITDGAFDPATPLDELRAALATLTRIPIGRVRGDVSGAAAFGLVGALVGGVGAVPLLVLGARDGSSIVAAILALAAIAIVSGVFHLDGLADTADALVAIGPAAAERARKDPSLGAGGAVALICVLILDVACVDSLVRTVGPPAAAAVLVVAGAGSRAFAVGVAFVARGRAVGDGMGARFAASVSSVAVLVAGGSALALSVLALPVGRPDPGARADRRRGGRHGPRRGRRQGASSARRRWPRSRRRAHVQRDPARGCRRRLVHARLSRGLLAGHALRPRPRRHAQRQEPVRARPHALPGARPPGLVHRDGLARRPGARRADRSPPARSTDRLADRRRRHRSRGDARRHHPRGTRRADPARGAHALAQRAGGRRARRYRPAARRTGGRRAGVDRAAPGRDHRRER